MTLSGKRIRTQELTFKLINFPENGLLSGTIPHLIYTPDENFYGVDYIIFKIFDGSYDSEAATISITVCPINDPPLANQLNLETQEDTALEFSRLGFDPDGDSVILHIESPLLHGDLAGYFPNYTYILETNFHGIDHFTYHLSDGVEQSESVSVDFTVHPVNDPPEAFEQHLILYQGERLELTLSGSDPDDDTLIYSIISGPKNGHLAGNSPDLIYQPDKNFWGEDNIAFKISDGELESDITTIRFTIRALSEHPTYKANSAPVAEDLIIIVENDSTQIILCGNDPDDDMITFKLTSNPLSGTLSGNPLNLLYSRTNKTGGFDSFSYTVGDGMKTSMPAKVRLFIMSNNNAPIANSLYVSGTKNKSKSITLSGTDPDNDPLTFSITTLPSNGTLSGNAPDLIYLPDNNFTGIDGFTYTVNDGSKNSSKATVNIYIPIFNIQTDKPVIDLGAPVISSIADQETLEDIAANEIEFTIATGDSACSLTINISSSNQTILPDKYIIYECNNNIYDLVATPALNQFGSVTITVLATDSSALTSCESFKLTITDVNDDLGYWINYQEADIVQGQSDFTSYSEGLSISRFSEPLGIAVDPVTGTIYVADQNNYRVIRFDDAALKSDGSDSDGVLGNSSLSVKESSTTQSCTYKVNSVFVDNASRIYVCDSLRNRIVIFNDAANKPDAGLADNVLGQSDFTSSSINGGETVSSKGLRGVRATFLDPLTNSLWVTDRYNNRILRFSLNMKTEPDISNIANQWLEVDAQSNSIDFTITDADPETLTVLCTSSDTSLIDPTGITINQSSAGTYTFVNTAGISNALSMTINPITGQSGIATITITVIDSVNFSDVTSFTVIVMNNYQNIESGNESGASESLFFTATNISGDETVKIGHNGLTQTTITVLYSGEKTRWNRLWYLEKSGSIDTTLTFDFSDAGNSIPGDEFQYCIIKSTDMTSFTSLSDITSTVSGNQVSFTVEDTDLEGGYYYTIAYNQVATDIYLSKYFVRKNVSIGTPITTLSNNDPDIDETYAYSLVSGQGSDDNASFYISDNELKNSILFTSFSKMSYKVRIRVNGGNAGIMDKQFTLTIRYVSPPGVNAGNVSQSSFTESKGHSIFKNELKAVISNPGMIIYHRFSLSE